MPVGYAGAANTSTSALNVVPNIPQVNVRSPQSTNDPILVNPHRQLTLKVLGSQPVTPVKVDRFENLLDGYSPALKRYLVDGFRFGFRIHFIGELSQFESPNLKSALQSPEVAFAKLMKEIDAGRIAHLFLFFAHRPLA